MWSTACTVLAIVAVVIFLPSSSDAFVPTNVRSPFTNSYPVRTIDTSTGHNPRIDRKYYDDSTTTTSTSLFGIPKMFRWLTDQYPNIINSRLTEGLSPDTNVDNFYLDMNGIIHPCTHGNAEGEIIYLDETAMFKKIFMYIDRLYKMVQPNEILYLAVDGVAPRAKMNQQRSRRFRSAKVRSILPPVCVCVCVCVCVNFVA